MAYRTYVLGRVVERRLVRIESYAWRMVVVAVVVDDVEYVLRTETEVHVVLK